MHKKILPEFTKLTPHDKGYFMHLSFNCRSRFEKHDLFAARFLQSSRFFTEEFIRFHRDEYARYKKTSIFVYNS